MQKLINASISWHKSYEGQWQVFGTENVTVERIVEACKRLGNWHRHKDTISGQDLDESAARDVLRAVDEGASQTRIIRACNKLISRANRKRELKWTKEFWHFVHSKDSRMWAAPCASFSDAVEATADGWGLIAKPEPRIVTRQYCEKQNWKGVLARAYIADRPMNSAKDVIEHGRFVGYVEIGDRENAAHDIVATAVTLIKEAGANPLSAAMDKMLTDAYAILRECGYDRDECFDWFDEYVNDIDEWCIFVAEEDGTACFGERWKEEIEERRARREEMSA